MLAPEEKAEEGEAEGSRRRDDDGFPTPLAGK